MKIIFHNTLFTVIFILVLISVSSTALNARGVDDLGLTERIILTLANSVRPDYQYNPDDVNDLMQQGDVYIDEEQGIYTQTFREKIGDFKSSGYYRIATPSLTDVPKEEKGWIPLEGGRDSEAGFWYRDVRNTQTGDYNEIQAELDGGNLILTVSMRRSAAEPAGQAQQDIAQRFQVFLENAVRYGLFNQVVVEFMTGQGEAAVAQGDFLNVIGSEDESTRLNFKVYAVDGKGNRLANVDLFSVKFMGSLGQYAHLENGQFNEEKGYYEVRGGPETLLTIILPPFKDERFADALEADAKKTTGFGLDIDVNVILTKGETS